MGQSLWPTKPAGKRLPTPIFGFALCCVTDLGEYVQD